MLEPVGRPLDQRASNASVRGVSSFPPREGPMTDSTVGERDIGSTLVVILWIDGPGWARGRKAGERGVDGRRIGRVGEAGDDVYDEEERRKGEEREDQLPHEW